MNYRIRRLQANDLDAILALGRRIPEAPHWSRGDYERCAETYDEARLRRTCFIAETDATGLLGFAVVRLVAGVCELESIAVVREARGKGIGIALLASLADWGRSTGALRMELEVRASNERAIKLYERFGLRREGMRPLYYQSPNEDAVLMGMTLAGSGKIP